MCIDDVGLSAGIDQAAERLVAVGRVHALSVLVGAPHAHAAAPMLRRLDAAQVDVGLHLDLTQHPLTRPPQRLAALLASLLAGRTDDAALRREIEAQLDAFEHLVGRPPAYVDGHQHVHQLPRVRAVLLAALDDRHRDGRKPWLRSTRPPGRLAMGGTGARDRVKPLVIAALGDRALERAARRHGYVRNAHLLGVYDFAAAGLPAQARLRGWLRSARDGDLLMCHPSTAAEADDPIAAARLREYEALAAPAFAAACRESGIELVPMSRILAEPRGARRSA